MISFVEILVYYEKNIYLVTFEYYNNFKLLVFFLATLNIFLWSHKFKFGIIILTIIVHTKITVFSY